MTNLEMTKLCAVAMGLTVLDDKRWAGMTDAIHTSAGYYDPLADDAQAMALVKKLGISVRQTDPDMWHAWIPLSPAYGGNADLNRAIVECAAKTRT